MNEIIAKMRAKEQARRDALSPEQRATEDEARARALARQAEAKRMWAEVLDGQPMPEDPALQWTAKAKMFDRLAPHDFFDGPGRIPVQTLFAQEDGFWQNLDLGQSVEQTDPPNDPIFLLLREAVTQAGLRGRIRLTMSETRWPDGKRHRERSLCFMDWDLLPQGAQERWAGETLRVLSVPYSREMMTMFPSGTESGLWGAVRTILLDGNHVLTPYLIAGMTGSGDGVAVWPTWYRLKNPHNKWSIVTYADIPAWPEVRVSSPDVLGTLDAGVVVSWPPTGERIRIRLARTESLDPSQWTANVAGERILSATPTEDPLTETSVDGNLRVFGVGRSQQTDAVPVVAGATTVSLLSWTDPADFSITITTTLGTDDLPSVAWLDSSAT